MNDAVLNFGLEECGLNGRVKSHLIARTDNKNIFDTPRSQTIKCCCPALGDLVFIGAYSQNIFTTALIDTNGNVHRYFHNLPFATDMVMDESQKESMNSDGRTGHSYIQATPLQANVEGR